MVGSLDHFILYWPLYLLYTVLCCCPSENDATMACLKYIWSLRWTQVFLVSILSRQVIVGLILIAYSLNLPTSIPFLYPSLRWLKALNKKTTTSKPAVDYLDRSFPKFPNFPSDSPEVCYDVTAIEALTNTFLNVYLTASELHQRCQKFLNSMQLLHNTHFLYSFRVYCQIFVIYRRSNFK